MRLSRGSSGAVPRVKAAPGLRPIQVESWRLLWAEYAADRVAQSDRRLSDSSRRRVRPEVAALLGRFLTGEIDVGGLRAWFDRRTKTDWGGFGLQGTSGAMFLNVLVKHAPDAAALDAALRDALPAPEDEREARVRLAIFRAFLREVRGAAIASSRVLHESHAAFFVSMWWHLQAPDQWPLFHPTARRALETEEELYTPQPDAVEDYLAFRTAFLTLAGALSVSPWALEHLCWWYQRREPRGDESPFDASARSRRLRTGRRSTPVGHRVMVVREPTPADAPRRAADVLSVAVTAQHTHVQWLLA